MVTRDPKQTRKKELLILFWCSEMNSEKTREPLTALRPSMPHPNSIAGKSKGACGVNTVVHGRCTPNRICEAGISLPLSILFCSRLVDRRARNRDIVLDRANVCTLAVSNKARPTDTPLSLRAKAQFGRNAVAPEMRDRCGRSNWSGS